MRYPSETNTKSIVSSVRTALVALTMLIMCSFTASAQWGGVVSGFVYDEAGEPLPGVSVVVKGKSTAAVSTDIDGMYKINVPADGTLVFSYVGMLPEEVKVGGKSKIDVTLKEDTQLLDEVVVVGYGQQKR